MKQLVNEIMKLDAVQGLIDDFFREKLANVQEFRIEVATLHELGITLGDLIQQQWNQYKVLSGLNEEIDEIIKKGQSPAVTISIKKKPHQDLIQAITAKKKEIGLESEELKGIVAPTFVDLMLYEVPSADVPKLRSTVKKGHARIFFDATQLISASARA
jgi:hypothetical protein